MQVPIKWTEGNLTCPECENRIKFHQHWCGNNKCSTHFHWHQSELIKIYRLLPQSRKKIYQLCKLNGGKILHDSIDEIVCSCNPDFLHNGEVVKGKKTCIWVSNFPVNRDHRKTKQNLKKQGCFLRIKENSSCRGKSIVNC